jgi:cytochrome c biogenesis protein CcdA
MDAGIFVPIGICVVLPIVIVWLVLRARKNETDRKAEIMLKALEAGVPIDPNLLSTQPKKKARTIKQDLLERLTGASVTSALGVAMIIISTFTNYERMYDIPLYFAGGILIAIGIALFIAYFVGKKLLAKEIEAEERALTEKAAEDK